MKKLLALLGLITLCLLVVTPKLTGMAIADAEALQYLRTQTGQPGLNLTLESGWFSSTGEVSIDGPVIGGTRYEQIRLNAPFELIHGPLLVTDEGIRLGITWAQLHPRLSGLHNNALIQSLFSAEADSTVRVLAGLDGALHGSLSSGPIEQSLNGTHVELNNFELRLDIARNGNLILNANTSALRLQSPTLDALVTDAMLELRSQGLGRSPLPGSINISAATLASTLPSPLTLHGIRLDYAASVQPESESPASLILQQHVAVQQIESALPITGFEMQSEVLGMDLMLVQEYMSFLREAPLLMATMSDAELQQHIEAHSEAFTLALLQNPLQQTSTLNIEAWEGEHAAELSLVWPGEPNISHTQQLSLTRVVRLLALELEVAANTEALYRTPLGPAIRASAAQGMLQQENGNLILSASLQEGNLSLNGQRFPLQPILNLITPGTP
jgi:hypothetical protein